MKLESLLTMIMLLLVWVADGYWSQSKAEEVRLPAVAGAFYPGSANELRGKIKAYLDSVPEIKPACKILAAVAPHAGYTYSGAVAAYTHKVISAVDFHTLVIIGHDSY